MPRVSGSSLSRELQRTGPESTTLEPLIPGAHPAPRWSALLIAIGCVLWLAGCGTNLDQVVYETIAAAGRTYLDLALTDAANDLAERREHDDDDDDAGDHADDDDADDVDGDDADGGELDDGNGAGGVTPDGTALFAANCAACHGEDGASGFAPDITEKTVDEVTAGLELTTHSTITLTAEEIAAITAFLGGDATDTGPTGDPVAGEQVFTGNACGACHCADATGGCALDAPSLVGADLATVEAILIGEADHPGGKFELDEGDLANLQAYLASLE